MPRQADDAGRRADAHKGPAGRCILSLGLIRHVVNERLNHVDGTHEVDVDDALPLLVRKRPGITPDGNPRDMMHFIGSTEVLDGPIRPLLDGIDIGDVKDCGIEDAPTGVPSHPHGACQPFGVAIRKNQSRLIFGEAQRECAADAGRGSGDDDDTRGRGHGSSHKFSVTWGPSDEDVLGAIPPTLGVHAIRVGGIEFQAQKGILEQLGECGVGPVLIFPHKAHVDVEVQHRHGEL